MRFCFGEFEFDEDRFELTRSGEPIAIQPKPLELLLCLLRRHPATVTKDELLDALWPDSSVTESSLTRAVRSVRRAMGESADSEGVIRTVRGRGYAISVPVEIIGLEATSHDPRGADASGIQRRLAALLSADAVDYRRHLAQDESAAVAALERHRRRIAECVTKCGGRVVDAVGDNLLAEFGSAVEALRAAIASQEGIAEADASIPEARRLIFRIGIHLGDLLVDGERVFGDGVNVAARLESLAPAGGIAASQVVVDEARGKVPVEWEDRGEQHLKSVSSPMRIYHVRGLGQEPRPARGGEAIERRAEERERQIVGREAPLAELEAALRDAEAGRGALAFLVGEPGIGKTRTAEEFADRATARGAEVMWGRCMEGQAAPALWPIVQLLRAAVESREADTLRQQLGARAPFIAEVVSEVRDKLPDLPEAPRHDSEEGRFRFHDGLARFLAHAAEQHPLVLVVEDLHWADASSLQLLRFLAPELASSRVLFLLTYRDVAATPGAELDLALADLARLPHARPAIPLRGLTREEVGQLVAQSTGTDPEADLLESLYARTEGNPFFVSELVRLLESRTNLAEPTGGGRSAIPSSVKAVVRQRVTTLPEASRRLLQTAAVIGRDAPLPLLAAALDQPEDELFDALEDAEASGLLIEHPDDSEQMRFSHALVQETIYDALSRRERVSLHRRVGEAIEMLHQPKVEPYLPALAHHFRQSAFGAQFEKAVDYLERAARQAHSQLAFERSAELCADAIRLLEARGPGDERRHAGLLLAQGRALIESGHPLEGQALAWRAIETAREVGAPEIVVDAARHLVGNNYTSAYGEELMDVLEEALQQLGPAEEVRRIVALCARGRAGYFILPMRELDEISSEAVERARALGDPDALRWALGSGSTLLLGSPNLEERRRLVHEWLELAREAHDSLNEFLCRLHRLSLSLDTIDRSSYERELDECDRLSDALRRRPIVEGPLVDARATWLISRGLLEEGERCNAEAFELNQRADQTRAYGSFALKLGIIRRAQGRLGEIDALLSANLSSLPEWMNPSNWGSFGILDVALERPESARTRLEEGLASEKLGRHDLINTIALATLAEVAEALDHEAAAQRLYDLAIPFAGRCAHAYVSACFGSVDRALGLCAKTLGRFDDAQRHFEDGLAVERRMGFQLEELQTLIADARMRQRRDEGGDAGVARGQLEDAMRIADECGAKGFAEQARTLLD